MRLWQGSWGQKPCSPFFSRFFMTMGGVGLYLPFKSDSSCFLAMRNPQVDLKNVLLRNAVEAFRDDLRRISIAFPKAIITVGHIPGESNPADTMTKIFRDPVKVINSDLYRSL